MLCGLPTLEVKIDHTILQLIKTVPMDNMHLVSHTMRINERLYFGSLLHRRPPLKAPATFFLLLS